MKNRDNSECARENKKQKEITIRDETTEEKKQREREMGEKAVIVTAYGNCGE